MEGNERRRGKGKRKRGEKGRGREGEGEKSQRKGKTEREEEEGEKEVLSDTRQCHPMPPVPAICVTSPLYIPSQLAHLAVSHR